MNNTVTKLEDRVGFHSSYIF